MSTQGLRHRVEQAGLASEALSSLISLIHKLLVKRMRPAGNRCEGGDEADGASPENGERECSAVMTFCYL